MQIEIKKQDAETILSKSPTKDQSSKMIFKRAENLINDSPHKQAQTTIFKDSHLFEKQLKKENIELNQSTLKVKPFPTQNSETFHLKEKNPSKEQSHSAPKQNENRIRTIKIKEKNVENIQSKKSDDLTSRQTTTIMTTPRESGSYLPKIISPLYERFLSSILRMSGKKENGLNERV